MFFAVCLVVAEGAAIDGPEPDMTHMAMQQVKERADTPPE
jgi:hypothetical protein